MVHSRYISHTLRSLYKYTIQVLLMMIILSNLNIMEDNGVWDKQIAFIDSEH